MKIAFAGKIASGKSTLANAIAERIGARRIGFADKVRAVVGDLYGPGHDKNRRLLTGVGMGLRAVDPDTWVNVVLEATKAPDTNWVLDDIRFPNELHALQRAGWMTVRIIVDQAERSRRIIARYGPTAHQHLEYGRHVSETSLDKLPDDAFDYVIIYGRESSAQHALYPGEQSTKSDSPLTSGMVVTDLVNVLISRLETHRHHRLRASSGEKQ